MTACLTAGWSSNVDIYVWWCNNNALSSKPTFNTNIIIPYNQAGWAVTLASNYNEIFDYTDPDPSNCQVICEVFEPDC